MFLYAPGPLDLETALVGLKDTLLALGTPTPWTLVYENSSGNNNSLSTLTGTEINNHHFFVLKSKLSHNTLGTGLSEYTYIMLEADVVNTEIVVRLCRTCTTGGTTTGVTPYADASQFAIDNITGVMAAGAFGNYDAVTILIDNASVVKGVTVSAIAHVLGFPHVDQNDFVCLVGPSSALVQNVTGLFDTKTPEVDDSLSIQVSAGVPLVPIALTKVSDPNYLAGVVRGAFYGFDADVQDFDIINPVNTPKLYRCLTTISGFIGAEDT